MTTATLCLSTTALAALTLALQACARQAPELTDHERLAVWAAVGAWKAIGMPEPKDCDLPATTFRVGACRLPTTHGCTDYEGRKPYKVVITIRPQDVGDDKLIAHELMHAMYSCSRAHGAFNGLNYYHLEPRVWEDVGGDASAQARTRSSMALTVPEEW